MSSAAPPVLPDRYVVADIVVPSGTDVRCWDAGGLARLVRGQSGHRAFVVAPPNTECWIVGLPTDAALTPEALWASYPVLQPTCITVDRDGLSSLTRARGDLPEVLRMAIAERAPVAVDRGAVTPDIATAPTASAAASVVEIEEPRTARASIPPMATPADSPSGDESVAAPAEPLPAALRLAPLDGGAIALVHAEGAAPVLRVDARDGVATIHAAPGSAFTVIRTPVNAGALADTVEWYSSVPDAIRGYRMTTDGQPIDAPAVRAVTEHAARQRGVDLTVQGRVAVSLPRAFAAWRQSRALQARTHAVKAADLTAYRRTQGSLPPYLLGGDDQLLAPAMRVSAADDLSILSLEPGSARAVGLLDGTDAAGQAMVTFYAPVGGRYLAITSGDECVGAVDLRTDGEALPLDAAWRARLRVEGTAMTVVRQGRPAVAAAVAATPARPTLFRTAKGSTYRIDANGSTTRDKARRPEHGDDAGPQTPSERTVYVDRAALDMLAEFQTRGGAGTRRLAFTADGKLGIQYVDGPDAGKFERRTLVLPEQAPRRGLYPVEMWNEGQQVHFGNEIAQTWLEGDVVPSADVPAAAPTRVEERMTAPTPSASAVTPTREPAGRVTGVDRSNASMPPVPAPRVPNAPPGLPSPAWPDEPGTPAAMTAGDAGPGLDAGWVPDEATFDETDGSAEHDPSESEWNDLLQHAGAPPMPADPSRGRPRGSRVGANGGARGGARGRASSTMQARVRRALPVPAEEAAEEAHDYAAGPQGAPPRAAATVVEHAGTTAPPAAKPPAWTAVRGGVVNLDNWYERGLAGDLWAIDLLAAITADDAELDALKVLVPVKLYRQGFGFSRIDRERIQRVLTHERAAAVDAVRVFRLHGTDYFALETPDGIRVITRRGANATDPEVRAQVAAAYGQDAPVFVLRSQRPVDGALARTRSRRS